MSKQNLFNKHCQYPQVGFLALGNLGWILVTYIGKPMSRYPRSILGYLLTWIPQIFAQFDDFSKWIRYILHHFLIKFTLKIIKFGKKNLGRIEKTHVGNLRWKPQIGNLGCTWVNPRRYFNVCYCRKPTTVMYRQQATDS